MDEMVLLTILGALSFALILSLVLHVMTFRGMRMLENRMSGMAAEQSGLTRPRKTEFVAPVSGKDMTLLLKRHNSIEESLRALAELSQVEWITLATRDGLVVASNYQDAQSDAANYSYLIKQGGEQDEPGVKVWQIDHKAGPLIGIARSNKQIDEGKFAFMIENVTKILNYWI
jgi:hypothetical protein